MRPESRWEATQFAWGHYPPAVCAAIALARLQSLRLKVCSLCGKARVKRHGVLVPPGLKRVEPTDERPLPYAVCREHDALSMEELGDALLPGWREHDTP
jgi:hypothetical protein